MRLVAVLVAVLPACMEPSFDTCAGLACPADHVCRTGPLGPSCPPIAGCDVKVDGATCDVGTGQEATCADGACIAVERCGNGILESLEACDCGDPGSPDRPACNGRNNSDDDPLAPCRADCTSRSCGDGIRDGNELCEGALFADDLTCGTFGYYDGELTCSQLCIVDTTGCSGRCGDGLLDTAREFCDASSPERPSQTCMDFGFATGRLACSPQCGPTFTGCRPGSVFVDLLPMRSDLVDLVPGPTADEAWVAVSTGILRYAKEALVTYPALTSVVLDLSSAGTRAAVSLGDTSVVIYEASGIVETLDAPGVCVQLVMTSPTTIACLTSLGTYWWNGTAWGALLPGPGATDAIAHPDGSVIYTKYGGTMSAADEVFRVTAAGVTVMTGWTRFVEHFDHIPSGETPTTGGIYGGLAYGGTGYGLVHYDEQSDQWTKVMGTEGTRAVASVGGRTMWATPPAEQMVLPNRSATLDTSFYECSRFLTIGTTGLCLTRSLPRQLLRFGGATTGNIASLPLAAGTIRDFAIDNNDVIYAINSVGAGTSSPGGWTPPSANSRSLWGARDGKVVLIGQNGNELAYGQPGNWKTRDFTILPVYVAALGATDHVVYASDTVGACVVNDWNTVDDTTATLAPIPCPNGLWASPTGHVWASYVTGVYDVTADAPALTVTKAPLATIGSISGIDDTHVWFAANGQIWFWNGTSWTKQLDDPMALFDWISASPSGVVATAGGSGRTTWILAGFDTPTPTWMKLRVPGDQTPMLEPQLRPWGIVYRSSSALVQYAAWQEGWVE